MNPGLILLDEPTANLDPVGVREVRDAIADVATQTGATLIVIEHRTEVWLPVVDRIVVMDGAGRIIGDGDPTQVIERQRIELLNSGVWVPGAPTPRLERIRHSDTSALLTASDLSVGRNAARVTATIDVAIRRGRTTAVVGPNVTIKNPPSR